MTSHQIKTNQQIFEVAGAFVCSAIVGFILMLLDASVNESVATSRIGQFCEYLLFAACCYLGLCYLFDKIAELRSWDVRINWLLISLIGTSLLSLTDVLPALVKSDNYHVKSLEDIAAATVVLLFVLNIVTMVMMGGVYLMGCLFRSAAEREMRLRIVP